MSESLLHRVRRADTSRLETAVEYAAMGWPVCPGAEAGGTGGRHLRQGLAPRGTARTAWGAARETGRACSCDRIGCPAPGAHPISPAWQIEASDDPAEVARWWRDSPSASIILVTGRVFDVLDVPAAAGSLALGAMARDGAVPGPVALTSDGRALFFVATRGAPADESEWWSCHLDCEPGTYETVTGLRWHTRDSFVVGPASRRGPLPAPGWLRDPKDYPLPDALRLLGYLADACDEVCGDG